MKNNIQVIAILLSITIGLSLSSFGNLSAQSNVPPSSKTYRKLNANTQTPSNDFYSTKALKSNDDDDLNPGGSKTCDILQFHEKSTPRKSTNFVKFLTPYDTTKFQPCANNSCTKSCTLKPQIKTVYI